MERFFSGATRFFLLLAAVLFFGVTVGLQLLFSGLVPEQWQFENLPRWTQVTAVLLALLYVAGEVWSHSRRGFSKDQAAAQAQEKNPGYPESDLR